MSPELERFFRENPQWNDTTYFIYLHWIEVYGEYLATRSLTWQAAGRKDLENFQQQLLWTPNGKGGLQSANTIYQGLRFLRALYRWALARQLIRVDPMEGWILPRPASQPRTPLSWEQTQQLFRGPDLGRPEGHRDLLLLHLVYQGLSLQQCIQLELDSELTADDTLQAVRIRYLSYARPRLVGPRKHSRLLVTDRGLPWLTPAGLKYRMKLYLPTINALILHDSRRAHEAEVERRWAKLPDDSR